VYLLSVPTAPQNLRIMGFTITQLKIGWDMPEQINGTMKGYHVYLGKIDTQMEQLKIEFSLFSVQLHDIYSGTCAIRHLSFPTSCDIRQKLMVPKYFC
jgi:hypothetical protein